MICSPVKSNGFELVLGIETSCDETAASVLMHGRHVMSNVVSSQVDILSEYGGVVPEIAGRKHVEAVHLVVNSALSRAGVNFKDIDGLAVTQGPGLVGSLLVGFSYAKAAAFSTGKPICGVNHIHAHLLSVFLESERPSFPYVGLVVSGGHTSLYLARGFLNVELLGQTRDDAAGEAFDKIAKILGLMYPGGPVVSRLATMGDRKRFSFPRARLLETPFDFSFSGLKTAVFQKVRKIKSSGRKVPVEDICAGFEEAVVEILVEKTLSAAKAMRVSNVVATGGVAANSYLRLRMKEGCNKGGLRCFFPAPDLCTDNAAMVALTGFHQLTAGLVIDPGADVYSRLPLQ